MTATLVPTAENDFTFDRPFRLASGQELEQLTQRYAIYGRLNRDRDNAILVCHALSGSARWRNGGQMFDRANVLTRGVIVSSVSTSSDRNGSTGPVPGPADRQTWRRVPL